jgi:hypothetical protein
MMGDEGRGEPKRKHVDPPAPVSKTAITLDERYPMDVACMIAWMEFCQQSGHPEVARAIEEARSMVVRHRWPKLGSPLPRVPRDFKKRAAEGDAG